MHHNDPRWIQAKFASKCSKCKEHIGKGEVIYYYPLTKDVFSGECAKAAEKDFNSMLEQENFYGSPYEG